ncbi:MAG: hypothetical protein OEY78_02115 [Gammaproteobacteria bacterium]|nr:hypothetical protein [Gammaproteobacteria bacterium]
MRKVFILMLFALNMIYFHQAMAASPIDQTIIFYAEVDEGKDGDKKKDGKKKDGDEGAKEEDCE